MIFLVCSQIDLGDEYKVTGVATQGGDGLSEWVKSYKLQYTVDGSTWQYYGQVGIIDNIYLLAVLFCPVLMTLSWLYFMWRPLKYPQFD